MNKHFILFVVFCLNLSFVYAGKFKEGGIYYQTIKGQADAVEVTCKKEYDCGYSGSLVIPSTVTHGKKTYNVIGIGHLAFWTCYPNQLTSITLPGSIIYIGDCGFSGSEIEKITIPKSVKRIGWSPFGYCEKLKEIVVEEGNEYCFSDNGVLYSNAGELICYPSNRAAQSYTIKDGTKSIAGGAFHQSPNLQQLIIPNSVTQINRYAFYSKFAATIYVKSDMVSTIKSQCKATFGSVEKMQKQKTIEAAEEGDAASQYKLATEYYNKGQYAQALNMYLKAAESNYSYSCSYVGFFYFKGYGVKKDYSEAVKWYKKYLSQNPDKASATTKFNLGLMYASGGYGLSKDPAEAMSWFKAAENEYDMANETVNASNARKEYETLYKQGYREKTIVPAMLVFVDGSLKFDDANSNNALDANETCYVRFKVQNLGKGEGRNCKTVVDFTGNNNSVTAQQVNLKTIRPKEIREVNIPLKADLNTKDGQLKLSIRVDEEGGFGTQPIELKVETRSYNAPLIKVVDYAASSEYGSISKGRPFNLQVLMQNTKSGKADDVEVKVSFPNSVFLTSENPNIKFTEVEGGQTQTLNYEFMASNNYTASTIPIKITIKEKYGRFAESKTIDLPLNQTVASTQITLSPVGTTPTAKNIEIATIGSAVDKNIPLTNVKNENTFVVIIANENYQSVAKVPYAINDGRVFAQYCEKTLGVPSHNIEIATDATLNVMRREINWLNGIANKYNGDARLIFYYAGHGIPDEASKSAYLLPTDGFVADITSGYKVDDLYAQLAEFPTKSVTVFLDACFSGTKREGDMLASARGVAIRAKAGAPQGNMVVFSAATGDETAYPNDNEGHGMFTYFLLKKLQETKADVTLEELGEYIKTNVSRQSLVINKKSQTPTVNAAPEANGWQQWRLK